MLEMLPQRWLLQSLDEEREARQKSLKVLIASADQSGTGLGSALAGVHLLSLRALLALHIAAPTNLALAGPRHLSALSVVTPATADGLTVFVLVALAACGS